MDGKGFEKYFHLREVKLTVRGGKDEDATVQETTMHFNPFKHFVGLTKTCILQFKSCATEIKDCFQELEDSGNYGANFFDDTIKQCDRLLDHIEEHDTNDFSVGGYDIFSKIFEVHNDLILGIESQDDGDWIEREDASRLKAAATASRMAAEIYSKEFEESHVWIFMNFYRFYNPFYHKNEDGQYVAQSIDNVRDLIHFRSLGLYFMVCIFFVC